MTTIDRQAAWSCKDACQVSALNQGHGDVLNAIAIAEVMYAEDVLMRDLAGQQNLLLETLHVLRIAGEV